MVKVYAVPSHQQLNRTSGVDFARVIQPMNHLNGYKDFEVTMFDIHAYSKMNEKQRQKYWFDNAETHDAFFLNYNVLDWGFAIMAAPFNMKGKPIVYEMDDSIWDVRPDNPTYEQYHANNQKLIYNVTCMVNAADHVITTSGYLKNVIANNSDKYQDAITAIPNYVDLDRYNKTFEPKEDNEITIMHYGSTTHFEDLLQAPFKVAMQRIMDNYPNVKFVTVGSFLSDYRFMFGKRYENKFGDEDIYKWIDMFPDFLEQADIVVAPVEPDRYNRSKSFIKYLETSSTKRPGVWQDIYQYQEVVDHGKNGFLAKSDEEWYQSLKKLIDSVELRKKVGNEAYKTAKEYQIQDHVGEYADVFKKLLDK